MSLSDPIHRNNFLKFIREAVPAIISTIDRQIEIANKYIAIITDLEQRQQFEVTRVAISAGYLLSIKDIFKALHVHASAMPEPFISARSTNSLIRVALENWTNLLWINTEDVDYSKDRKTLIYLYANAEESRKYYISLGQNETAMAAKRVAADLFDTGKILNFLLEIKDKRTPENIHFKMPEMPSITNLCRRLDTLSTLPREDFDYVTEKYPGISAGEFIYRYLSGHVHGMQWVTKFDANQTMPIQEEPIFWIVNQALLTIAIGVGNLELATQIPFEDVSF